jgi:hypothetical protein
MYTGRENFHSSRRIHTTVAVSEVEIGMGSSIARNVNLCIVCKWRVVCVTLHPILTEWVSDLKNRFHEAEYFLRSWQSYSSSQNFTGCIAFLLGHSAHLFKILFRLFVGDKRPLSFRFRKLSYNPSACAKYSSSFILLDLVNPVAFGEIGILSVCTYTI